MNTYKRSPGRPKEHDVPMEPLQIYVPAEIKEELFAVARHRQTSVTKLVSALLQKHRGRW